MLKTDVALGGIAGRTHSSLFAGAMVAGGLAGLILGAHLLVDGAVAAARMLGVGEDVIGSNIFNILAVMGVTAAIAPVPVPQRFLALDIWVMLAAAVMLLIFALARRPAGRGAGAAFLLAYALYLTWLFRLGGV